VTPPLSAAPNRPNHPIGFAHRGARANAPENTLDAFGLALRLGARGLESDVWLTADGIPVLDHDGVAGGRFRRRAFITLERAALAPHVPALADLYGSFGTDFELSLDVKDPAAFAPVVAAAATAGGQALSRLWLCHSDPAVLAGWRPALPVGHLVLSTRIRRLPGGLDRHLAPLRTDGVDAVNLPAADWDAAAVAAVHERGLLALAWGAQTTTVLRRLLGLGVDGVYSDDVSRMQRALEEAQSAKWPDPDEGSTNDEIAGDKADTPADPEEA
jgi:glycerophosphoryl diester phosphodiesterase